MNDQLTNKIIDIITQLQTSAPLATKHSMDMALQVISYGGFINILDGVICISIALLTLRILMRSINIVICTIEGAQEERTAKEDIYIIRNLLLRMILIMVWSSCLIFGITKLANIWNYVALVNPKIYFAHQIIEKVVS